MKFLILTICIFLLGCSDNKKSVNVIRHTQKEIVKNDKENEKKPNPIKYSDSISHFGYTIRVVNFPVEEITNDIADKFQYRHLMHYQKLVITCGNQVVDSVSLPIPTTKVILQSGSKSTVWNHRIFQLGIIKGKKGFLFYVSGFEGCNACDEFYALVSSKGEIKYLEFRGRDPIQGKNIADWKTATDEIDCPSEVYNEGKFEKVFVVDGIKEFKGI